MKRTRGHVAIAPPQVTAGGQKNSATGGKNGAAARWLAVVQLTLHRLGSQDILHGTEKDGREQEGAIGATGKEQSREPLEGKSSVIG